MKRNLIGTLTLVVVSLLLNATGAYAESIAKADVPFAFTVSGMQLPAGRYTMMSDSQATLTIQNGDSGTSVLSLIRTEVPRAGSPKLVFHNLGNQYFLAEVWGADGKAGLIVPASKLEKELRMASGPSNSVGQVVIALK
jgi:hypothetical protein